MDQFLTLAFDFSHEKNTGLQGFVEYCQSTNPDIKRDFSSANLKAVRIMTVHGAKGLQAPIVFLPDTTRVPAQYPVLLWEENSTQNANQKSRQTSTQTSTQQIIPIWRTPSALSCEKTESLKEAEKTQQMAEYYRLLYVALTRAEDELIIAGWETTQETSDQCWYHMVEPSVRTKGIRQGDESNDEGYVYDCPQRRTIPLQPLEMPKASQVETPQWLFQNPPSEIGEAEPLSPSAFFGQKNWEDSKEFENPEETQTLVSLLETAEEDPYREGTYSHKLLEILPNTSPDQWQSVAATQASHYGLVAYERTFEAVQNLLTHDDFQDIFAESTYAEIDISGEVRGQKFNGQIDRLLIKDHQIRIIDFKSNKIIPKTLEEVPTSYLGQLSIYKALLQKVYPQHEIVCELVWVRAATRMLVPTSFLDAFGNEIC